MRRWLMLVALLALAALLAACGDDKGNDETTGTTAGTPATAAGMVHGQSSPMAAGDPDLAFIDGMIPHHEGAIAMAEIAIERAEHEELRQLARDIISAQQHEIEQLRQWREQWFPGAPASQDRSGMGHDMPGMTTASDDLEQLRSAERFDLAFIEAMVPHHEAAIAMAEELLLTTQRPELRQLAQDIIRVQQAEIDQLRRWQQEWSQ